MGYHSKSFYCCYRRECGAFANPNKPKSPVEKKMGKYRLRDTDTRLSRLIHVNEGTSTGVTSILYSYKQQNKNYLPLRNWLYSTQRRS